MGLQGCYSQSTPTKISEFICVGVRQVLDNGQTTSHNMMGLSVFLFLLSSFKSLCITSIDNFLNLYVLMSLVNILGVLLSGMGC